MPALKASKLPKCAGAKCCHIKPKQRWLRGKIGGKVGGSWAVRCQFFVHFASFFACLIIFAYWRYQGWMQPNRANLFDNSRRVVCSNRLRGKPACLLSFAKVDGRGWPGMAFRHFKWTLKKISRCPNKFCCGVSLFVTLPDLFVAAWLLDSRPCKRAHARANPKAASWSYFQALHKVADQLQHLNWSLKHAARLGGLKCSTNTGMRTKITKAMFAQQKMLAKKSSAKTSKFLACRNWYDGVIIWGHDARSNLPWHGFT